MPSLCELWNIGNDKASQFFEGLFCESWLKPKIIIEKLRCVPQGKFRMGKAFLTTASFFVLLTISSCKDNNNQQGIPYKEQPPKTTNQPVTSINQLPEINVDELKETEFVPTLESPINDQEKNVIYASAFLYAWDK